MKYKQCNTYAIIAVFDHVDHELFNKAILFYLLNTIHKHYALMANSMHITVFSFNV